MFTCVSDTKHSVVCLHSTVQMIRWCVTTTALTTPLRGMGLCVYHAGVCVCVCMHVCECVCACVCVYGWRLYTSVVRRLYTDQKWQNMHQGTGSAACVCWEGCNKIGVSLRIKTWAAKVTRRMRSSYNPSWGLGTCVVWWVGVHVGRVQWNCYT